MCVSHRSVVDSGKVIEVFEFMNMIMGMSLEMTVSQEHELVYDHVVWYEEDIAVPLSYMSQMEGWQTSFIISVGIRRYRSHV